MIIAVLSNVYVAVVGKIDADHNANLVLAYSKMKYDKIYGLLIFSFPPFNMISFALMPFLLMLYFCAKEKTIKAVNKVFCQITYFPMAIV